MKNKGLFVFLLPTILILLSSPILLADTATDEKKSVSTPIAPDNAPGEAAQEAADEQAVTLVDEASVDTAGQESTKNVEQQKPVETVEVAVEEKKAEIPQASPSVEIAQPVEEPKIEAPAPSPATQPVAVPVQRVESTAGPKIDPVTMKALLVLFRDKFYVPDNLKIKYNLTDYRDFVLQDASNNAWNSGVAVVTQFEIRTLESKLMRNINSNEEAQVYIDSHLKLHPYRSLDLPELVFDLSDGKTTSRYWVGQRGFSKLEEAQKAVDGFAAEVEKKNIPFTVFVTELKENGVPYEEPEEVVLSENEEVYGAAYANIEETVMNYLWEKADLARYSGKDADEPWFLWQSIFESTWRSTNFARHNNDSLTSYFANRIRVRGVRMPFGSSIDPTLEMVYSFTDNGVDFNNVLDGAFGVEYRPFRGIKALDKYWFTSWIKNIRGHVDYWQRFAVKDPILYAPDDDLRAGIDIYKEWGIEIPEENKPDFFWGEYYGIYEFRKTNFSGIAYENGYNSFVSGTRLTGGIKWPVIPLPANRVTDRITIMPYGGWEWVNNNHLGNAFWENRQYSFVGVRWMPFRDKRYERREWIYKTKVFFEYRGLGKLQYTKSNPPEGDPAYDIGKDFVFGVNLSSNRF